MTMVGDGGGNDSRSTHQVKFYEDQADLTDAVTDFLDVALADGGAAVVVALPSHRQAFEARLASHHHSVSELQLSGRYVPLDAAGLLRSLRPNGHLSEDRFQSRVGKVVRQAAGHGPVAAFGEMVDLLWGAGELSEALRLESMWNGLQQTEKFSLLCAYTATPGRFGRSRLPRAREVCQAHTTLLPPADYPLHSRVEADRGDVVKQRFYPPAAVTPRLVRAFVSAALRRWGQHALALDAGLVATELATNAILHADSPFELSLIRSRQAVRVEITDASKEAPLPRQASPEIPGGHGLALVESLAKRWGVNTFDEGKVVWAELTAR